MEINNRPRAGLQIHKQAQNIMSPQAVIWWSFPTISENCHFSQIYCVSFDQYPKMERRLLQINEPT